MGEGSVLIYCPYTALEVKAISVATTTMATW